MPWVGLVLILLGQGLRWTAILTLKKFFTVDLNIASDHQLVRRGVYRYLRHPSYAGSLLSFLGLGLAFSNWLSILVIVIPITVALLYRIRIEELMLSRALGEPYTRYALTTKRVIPFLW
jgi:protein-S-isoprenylcysteine O-methyltransferase